MQIALPSDYDSQLDADLAKRYLRHFVSQSWNILEPSAKYVPNWHIDAVAEHLEYCAMGQIKNLIINQPPGTMKSRLASVCYPAWRWIKNPSRQFLCASYGASLAWRDARYMRILVTSDWYKKMFSPKWALDKDAEALMINTVAGRRQSVGVEGEGTGLRGDEIIVDDALKVEDAYSDLKRESTNRWWGETFFSRVNDEATANRILIGHRLHQNDLHGYVLEMEPEKWVHLMLPMEFDAKRRCKTFLGVYKSADGTIKEKYFEDPRTEEGELLMPGRFDTAALKRAKTFLGSYGYAGQYQQTPAPAGGGKFQSKWRRYFDDMGDYYLLHDPTLPDNAPKRRILKSEIVQRFSVGDTAFTSKQTSDYTAIGTCDITRDHDILIFDFVHEQMQDPEVKAAFRSVLTRLRPDFIGIEDKQNGATAIQQFMREGMPIKAIPADTDKVTRATVAAIKMENGKIWFLRNALWLQWLEPELDRFPNGTNDDGCDVISNIAILDGAIPDLRVHFDTPIAKLESPNQYEITNERRKLIEEQEDCWSAVSLN